MRLTRRSILACTTSTVAVGVAGCLGGDGDDGDDEDTTAEEDTTVGEDGTTETDVETTTDETTTDGGDTTTGDDGTTTASSDATVRVRSHGDLGEILVGPDGMTLYMFDSDTQGAGASTCSGGCADSWPPLSVDGDATAGEGVSAELSTFERDDGTTQVAAAGWPLYYFAPDEAPGDAAGQGANDVWWVLRPDGTPVRSTTTTTTEGDGPGYGSIAA